MDEKNEAGQRPRYTWPWFVLGMVVLGFVLAIIWMSVLVRRTREQRDFNEWPAPTQPASPTNSAPNTNANSIKTNVDSVKAERMAEFREILSGGNAKAGRKIFLD